MRKLLVLLVMVLCAQMVLADLTKDQIDSMIAQGQTDQLNTAISENPAGAIQAIGAGVTDTKYHAALTQAFNQLKPEDFDKVKEAAASYFKVQGNLAGNGGQNYVNYVAGRPVDVKLPDGGFVTIDPARKTLSNGNTMPSIALDNLQDGTKITPKDAGQGFCITLPLAKIPIGSCGVSVLGNSKDNKDNDVAIGTKDGKLVLTQGSAKTQIAEVDPSVQQVVVQRVWELKANSMDNQRYKIDLTFPGGDQVVVSTKGLTDGIKVQTATDGTPGVILSEGQIAAIKTKDAQGTDQWNPIKCGGQTLLQLYPDHYQINSWDRNDVFVMTPYGMMKVSPPTTVRDPSTGQKVALASLDKDSLEFKRYLPEVWIGKNGATPTKDEMLKAGIPTAYVTADALQFSGAVHASVETPTVDGKRMASIDSGDIDYNGQPGYVSTFKATKTADGFVKPVFSIDGVPTMDTLANEYAAEIPGKRAQLTAARKDATDDLASLQSQLDAAKRQKDAASGDQKDTLKNVVRNLENTIDKRKDDIDKIDESLGNLPKERSSGDSLVMGKYKESDLFKALSKDPLAGPSLTLTRDNEVLSMSMLTDTKKNPDDPTDAARVKMVVNRASFLTPAAPVLETQQPVDVQILGTHYRTISSTGMTDENGKTVHFGADMMIKSDGNTFSIGAKELQLAEKVRLTDVKIAQGTITRDGDNDVIKITVPSLQDQNYDVQGEGFKMALAFFFYGKSGIKSQVEQAALSEVRNVQLSTVKDSMDSLLDVPGPKVVPEALAKNAPQIIADLQRQLQQLPKDYSRLGGSTLTLVGHPYEGDSAALDVTMKIDVVNKNGQGTRTLSSTLPLKVDQPTDPTEQGLRAMGMLTQAQGVYAAPIDSKGSALSSVLGGLYYLETSPDKFKDIAAVQQQLQGNTLQDKLALKKTEYQQIIDESVGATAVPPKEPPKPPVPPVPPVTPPPLSETPVPPPIAVEPAKQEQDVQNQQPPVTVVVVGGPLGPSQPEVVPPAIIESLKKDPVYIDPVTQRGYILGSDGTIRSTVTKDITVYDMNDARSVLTAANVKLSILESTALSFVPSGDMSPKMITIDSFVPTKTASGETVYTATFRISYYDKNNVLQYYPALDQAPKQATMTYSQFENMINTIATVKMSSTVVKK